MGYCWGVPRIWSKMASTRGWKLFRKWTPALMVVEARYHAVHGACATE